MTEQETSQVQQNVDAWKKIADRQLELVSTWTEEAARLRKIGLEKAMENVEEMHRFSQESVEHGREMSDFQEPLGTYKDLMDRQLEVVTGMHKTFAEAQGQAFEKTRSTLQTLTNLSETTLDHAIKLNQAWHDAAMDTAKRAAGWVPTSL